MSGPNIFENQIKHMNIQTTFWKCVVPGTQTCLKVLKYLHKHLKTNWNVFRKKKYTHHVLEGKFYIKDSKLTQILLTALSHWLQRKFSPSGFPKKPLLCVVFRIFQGRNFFILFSPSIQNRNSLFLVLLPLGLVKKRRFRLSKSTKKQRKKVLAKKGKT